MKLLAISDYFYNLKNTKTSDKVDYIQWGQYRNLSLRGYNCVLIDLTFKNDMRQADTVRYFCDLVKQFEDENLLANSTLIVTIVCGVDDIDVEYDEPYDPAVPNGNQELKAVSCYEFVRRIVPNSKSIKFGENNGAYPLAVMPVSLYLDKYKNQTSYLFYDLVPGSANSIGITPLAKMIESGNSCIAFECRVGGGMVIALPPYNTEDYPDAFQLLLRICRNYYKQKEGIKEILKIGNEVPLAVRNEFAEAISCFSFDLFTASVVMCRRTLEISASYFNIETEHKTLEHIINKLHEDGYIDSRIKALADIVRAFGNLGAHAPEGVNITEEDAINAIDFLKIYLQSVYSLRKQIQDSEVRIKQIKGGG